MKEKGIILSIDAQVAMLRDGYPVLMLPMSEQPKFTDFADAVSPKSSHSFQDHTGKEFTCPVGEAGNGIWVRESYGIGPDGEVRYRADHPSDGETSYLSPIKMGKDKARLRFTIAQTVACAADAASEIALQHLGSLDLGADQRQDVIARVVDLLPMDPAMWVWVILLEPAANLTPATVEAAPPPERVGELTAATAAAALTEPPGPFQVHAGEDISLFLASRWVVTSADTEPILHPTRENASEPILVAVLDHGDQDMAELLAASWEMRRVLRELLTLRFHKQVDFTSGVSPEEYEQRKAVAWEAAQKVVGRTSPDLRDLEEL